MSLNYFYEGDEDMFVFIRIPKPLFESPRYKGLSNDARVLYGLLLDRMSLSRRNGWRDDQGRIFVYFTINEIEKTVLVSHGTAVGLLGALEDYCLIARVRQGQGKPSRIYPLRITGMPHTDPRRSSAEKDPSDIRKTIRPIYPWTIGLIFWEIHLCLLIAACRS